MDFLHYIKIIFMSHKILSLYSFNPHEREVERSKRGVWSFKRRRLRSSTGSMYRFIPRWFTSRSSWVDLKEKFQPRDLLIVGWQPCRLPETVAPGVGACPALLSVDAARVQPALCALWLKPDYLHREGWALGRRIGGLCAAERRG